MMAFKTLFKYGVPLSFVYCTVYQQNIWREGDEKLFEEQKRVWRDSFTLISNGYNATMTKLNLPSNLNLVSKFDSLDIRKSWNTRVQGAFGGIDHVISHPDVTACKVYRKIQPYFSNKAETKSETSKTE